MTAQPFDRWLGLAAAATLIGSVLPLGARYAWALDLASHFRLQALVVALVLLLVFALRRRWLLAVVVAGAAAVNAAAVWPYLPFGVVEARAAGRPIRVMAANVLYENRVTAPLLAMVARESPDLLVLVEFTPRWDASVDALRAAYPYRLELPRWRSRGIAVYSRLPLAGIRPVDLGASTAIEARVLGPTGSFTLLGVHLRSPSTPRRARERNRELTRLADYRTGLDEPLVVIGDFNITPYSPYFTDWLAATNLSDTRRGRSLAGTWPTFLPILGIPIDHCVVSEEFEVVAQRRLPAFGSDHYPILVELALRPGRRETHAPPSLGVTAMPKRPPR